MLRARASEQRSAHQSTLSSPATHHQAYSGDCCAHLARWALHRPPWPPRCGPRRPPRGARGGARLPRRARGAPRGAPRARRRTRAGSAPRAARQVRLLPRARGGGVDGTPVLPAGRRARAVGRAAACEAAANAKARAYCVFLPTAPLSPSGAPDAVECRARVAAAAALRADRPRFPPSAADAPAARPHGPLSQTALSFLPAG